MVRDVGDLRWRPERLLCTALNDAEIPLLRTSSALVVIRLVGDDTVRSLAANPRLFQPDAVCIITASFIGTDTASDALELLPQ